MSDEEEILRSARKRKKEKKRTRERKYLEKSWLLKNNRSIQAENSHQGQNRMNFIETQTLMYHNKVSKYKELKKHTEGFPGGAVVENLPANAGDTGLSPGLWRSHMPRSS